MLEIKKIIITTNIGDAKRVDECRATFSLSYMGGGETEVYFDTDIINGLILSARRQIASDLTDEIKEATNG